MSKSTGSTSISAIQVGRSVLRWLTKNAECDKENPFNDSKSVKYKKNPPADKDVNKHAFHIVLDEHSLNSLKAHRDIYINGLSDFEEVWVFCYNKHIEEVLSIACKSVGVVLFDDSLDMAAVRLPKSKTKRKSRAKPSKKQANLRVL